MVHFTRGRIVVLTLLTVLAAAITHPAQATDRGSVEQEQLQNQYQQLTADQQLTFRNSINRDRLQIPPAAMVTSSSSNTTAAHRYLEQSGWSLLFFSKNGTEMKFDVVSFISSNPSPRQELAACAQEEGFRKFRILEKNPCPEMPK